MLRTFGARNDEGTRDGEYKTVVNLAGATSQVVTVFVVADLIFDTGSNFAGGRGPALRRRPRPKRGWGAAA